ncbi:DUF1653 domain-containing protein [Peribacillus asahii]|uniref:DUF1653 domain-containing protein n=1 Tax=Peribacillus asahii TaxID=228899 RepID=UPI0037FB571A
MAVKIDTKYIHYGNRKTYEFICIALPFSPMFQGVFDIGEAFHTEEERNVNLFHDGTSRKTVYSNSDEYLVLYRRKGEKQIYARPVDMFFEHINGNTKRFTLIQEGE